MTTTYLEVPGTKFWRCECAGDTVHITFGKLGATGQKQLKKFDTAAEATVYASKQEAAKAKKGYDPATDPLAPAKGTKRKAAPAKGPAAKKGKAAPAVKAPTAAAVKKAAAAAAKAAGAAAKPLTAAAKKKAASAAAVAGKKKKAVGPKTVAPKKTKQGLAGIGLVDEDEVGAVDVDSGVSAINSKVGAIATIHTDHHARLVHVDPAINSDKYYILQLLEADGEFYCFRRSGKTGTSGIGQLEGPFALSEAKKKFEDLFTKKCGQKWAKRDPDWVPANSKVYTYLRVSLGEEDATWEYHLTKDPMGKPDGWYPYDASAGEEVEALHQTFVVDENAGMSIRYVSSGQYTYRVDLSTGDFTQTNTTSSKSRPIRRVVAE